MTLTPANQHARMRPRSALAESHSTREQAREYIIRTLSLKSSQSMGSIAGIGASPIRASIESCRSRLPTEHTTIPRSASTLCRSLIATAAEPAANWRLERLVARYAGCTIQRPISTVFVRAIPSHGALPKISFRQKFSR
jgi:hypothetical protein